MHMPCQDSCGTESCYLIGWRSALHCTCPSQKTKDFLFFLFIVLLFGNLWASSSASASKVIHAGEMKCKLQILKLLWQYLVLTSTTIPEHVIVLAKALQFFEYLSHGGTCLCSIKYRPQQWQLPFMHSWLEGVLQSDLSLKAKIAGPAPVGSLPSFLWFTDHPFPSAGLLYLSLWPVASERNLIFPRQRAVSLRLRKYGISSKSFTIPGFWFESVLVLTVKVLISSDGL